MKTVKFYTLGCKVNQYDTQCIRERFAESGFQESDNGRAVDVVVVNTCTVTHRADADSLSIVRKAQRQNPKAKIIVTGCLAELDEKRIRDVSGVLIVRSRDKENIARFLNRSTGKPANRQTKQGISFFKGHTRAFLKIQDGCNHFCSYCKVPLVRGRSRSRSLKDIASEARRLVKNGHQEIVLCGICLGAYGKDLRSQKDVVQVVGALEKIKGLNFIRMSSIELNDITDALIDRMAFSKKLCPHLHIPLQSGDDRILERMNRGYTSADFMNKVLKIKRRIPGLAFTTDLLVGFPGEGEEHFRNTLKAIKRLMPLKVHAFPYSPREGTLAQRKYRKLLDAAVIRKRMARLKDLSEDCSRAYKKKFLNRKMDVLIERRWNRNPRFWQGRTPHYMEILVKSDEDMQNRLVRVKLSKIEEGYLLSTDNLPAV
jgi:threonylcarbamoyladenosine tRNA methylthiotransferase MtaB